MAQTGITQHPEAVRGAAGRRFRRLLRDDSGATAIEYALIAAFIAISIVVIAPLLGLSVAGLFSTVAGVL